MHIVRISKSGGKTCSYSSILETPYLIIFKNQLTMQFQYPFWCFFNKHQNEHRFTTFIHVGSNEQSTLSENVHYFTSTEANRLLTFWCFAQKYNRFNICPGALQPVFLICAKTPSFKHGVYCCPSSNHAIGQHFWRYSTKTKLNFGSLDVAPMSTNKTNQTRTAYDIIFAQEGCSFDSCRTKKQPRKNMTS